MTKELDREKDSRIIRQLERITNIYSGNKPVILPYGRGQVVYSVDGNITTVTAERDGQVESGRTYVDGDRGISLQAMTAVDNSTNAVRLTEGCASYLNAIYSATSEGHIDQSREVGYNYCMIVPDKMRGEDQTAMLVENVNGNLRSHAVPGEEIESMTYGIALQRAKFDFANNYGENPIHCLAEGEGLDFMG